ncbi:fibronectin type III domain-containing protein [Paenibacillus sp. S-38]|uniref:fibronectin type III domain-containing protein n=1 Tax=Paenibacillus sp. S-38 TaxID=3416710 RepID=UPI003CFAA999
MRNIPGVLEGGGGGDGGVIIAQPFKGKKIILIGNSVVAEQDVPDGQGWSTKLAAKSGATVIKYGYPGKPWSWKTALGATNTSIYSNRNSWDRTGDVYILYSGGNDPRLEIAKGVYTDTATDNNHMGTLRATVNLIRSWNPNAIVVIAISLPRDGPPGAVVKNEDKNLLGNSLMDHNAEARLLAYDLKCPVWDMFGIGMDYSTDYQTDRVHPNAAGSTKMADSGVGFLATLKPPAATDNTAPNVPARPTLVSKTHNSVTLSWTAVTDNPNPGGVGVASYIVEGGVSPVTVSSGTQTIISGLNPNTPYNFTLKARDANGNTSAASPALAVTTDAAPAGGGPTVYFRDTFSGADGSLNAHQPETGAPWDTSVATTPANWQLVGGAVKYTGTSGDKILIESGAPSGDYTLLYNVYAAGGKQGFIFRGLNGTNYLYVRYDAAAAGKELKLYKRSDATGAATTTMLHEVAATINTTSSHDIKIVVSGNNIKVYLEGSATAAMDFTLAAADATEYAGRTKVGMYAGGENTSQWNELTVQSNAATSTPTTDNTAPNVPARPTLVSKTHNSVTLSWTAVTDNPNPGGVGVTNYIIEGGPTAVTVGTGTQTTIPGLNPETLYNFTLKARDANGNTSTASPALAVTTDAAPTGGPTVYFRDTFSGPDGSLDGHAPETGQPWDTLVATTPANWQLVSGAAKYIGTTGDKIYNESGAPSGDYTLIYKVFAAGGKQGFVFRGLNGTNYLYVKYDAAAAGKELKLYKRSDATGTATTTMLHEVAATINTTTSHEIKIVVSGNNIKVYLEGSATAAMDFTLSAGDATEYAGRTKIGMYAGGENQSQWNEVTVQSNTA